MAEKAEGFTDSIFLPMLKQYQAQLEVQQSRVARAATRLLELAAVPHADAGSHGGWGSSLQHQTSVDR